MNTEKVYLLKVKMSSGINYFNTIFIMDYYLPRMREGNVFILSIYASVRAITFECLEIETSVFDMVVHLDHI